MLAFLARHANMRVGGDDGDTLGTWVRKESGKDVLRYIQDMRQECWGGPLELLAFACAMGREVGVYRQDPVRGGARHRQFTRIERFPHGNVVARESPVYLLHAHGNHYDVLIPAPSGD